MVKTNLPTPSKKTIQLTLQEAGVLISAVHQAIYDNAELMAMYLEKAHAQADPEKAERYLRFAGHRQNMNMELQELVTKLNAL